ncbi:MAG: DEAD/DEAH box helicase family protein, partial [Betaproteobacteria bacterium]|nr:DEAD/DEAH box helicase family protein [Betaproteobacteria bacterium]
MSSEVLEADNPTDPHAIALPDFLQRFGSGLLDAVRAQNPPLYVGQQNAQRHAVMEGLKRQPFPAQREVVQSMAKLLLDENQPAGVINAEMGTGKTMMAIALAAVMHDEGIKRCLVISPPHLVYKWRREIRNTVPNARVWVLNGPDTLKQLLTLRGFTAPPSVPEFFVMGRVRMRMGYQWRPAYMTRYLREADDRPLMRVAACASCGTPIVHVDEKGNETPLSPMQAEVPLNERQARCRSCGDALWTLILKRTDAKSKSDRLADALQQLPTIGNKTAQRLITRFGVEMLSGMLEDNVHEFINLLDENGELVFSDRQAARMERAMSNMAFSFGQGGYQPTEFIKRYLPQGFFGLLVVDEGHEYKNEGSAQGQAMGVLARKCQKTLLLTGTLMGGYADDLFYLLMRLNPTMMIEDGYYYNQKKSLATAALSFMRSHG